jgi:protein-arginine kinase activator protein McsA
MRKRIKFPNDYTKEELEQIIKIQNEIIKKHIGKINKDDVKKIKKENNLSISNSKLITSFNIASSSFYKAKIIKSELQLINERQLINVIVKIWEDSKENYGYRKI